MNIFLVGGAIRDTLLGLQVKDKDWVVVGADIQTLHQQHFRQIGLDFPVFLHPQSHEEYALARKERKTEKGHTGFICDFSPDVTLEEDLLRRDLTINAIAQAKDGTLIDPYGGQEDIKNKLLRHVSPAFSEDPLRVLRVARFCSHFHHLGFKIAEETSLLMKEMALNGELNALTPERIWKEWEKSLSSPHPEMFLIVLRECGALKILLPEIEALFGVPQPPQWHPEIDTGVHTFLVAEEIAKYTTDPLIRFAAQLHDLGKALTPKALWPSHKTHTQTGLTPIKALCERMKIPNAFRDAALLVCAEHSHCHRANELKPSTFVKLFDRNDFWRKPERVKQLVIASFADFRGRTGFEARPYPQARWLEEAFQAAYKVDVKPIVASGLKGEKIREELTKQRIAAVAEYLKIQRK